MIDFICITNDTTIDIKTICNPERISKLRSYINNYNFTDTSAKGFEVNNQHVSSEILDEDGNIVYSLSNTCKIKAVSCIICICSNKTDKNKYIKLREILQRFSHKEISDIIKQKIFVNRCMCIFISVMADCIE